MPVSIWALSSRVKRWLRQLEFLIRVMTRLIIAWISTRFVIFVVLVKARCMRGQDKT